MDNADFTKLLNEMRSMYYQLRDETRNRWQRDLPLEEMLFDRWERAKNLGFGEKSSIYHNSYIYGDVTVGQNTWIGPFTLLDGSGGLKIGDNCSISAGVQIYTHDTVKWALSGGNTSAERSPVSIGNNTYIGSQTVVAKGIEIGNHVVIGANTFVNKNIPSNSVAVGTPCRVVGRVEAGDEIKLIYD